MKTCPHCQHPQVAGEIRCPECGNFYSKIIELIDAEEQYERQQTWQWHYQQFKQAADKKQALLAQWHRLTADLSTLAWFTLFVIMAFVFALIISVL